jgi:2-dehydro-3-deoxygalactonokinase
MNGPFLAIDWGTTNRRCYRIEGGRVTYTGRDERGVLSIPANGFANEINQLRREHGEQPILGVGMIGSRRGWRETPYLSVPVSLGDLASAVVWIESGMAALTPGVSLLTSSRADVMRGEEVQFLGAVAAGLAPPTSRLCQPGTHCKWARIEGDRLVDFTTAMTGELFSLLRHHSLLAEVLVGTAVDGQAFRDGVEEAGRNSLLSALFGARAAWLLNTRSAADSASYVSGLLIGSDVQSHSHSGADEIYVLGEPPLGSLYATAIEVLGGRANLIDSSSAFVAGVTRLWECLT